MAEPFFVVSDWVGECFEAGAEVGDLGGECGEEDNLSHMPRRLHHWATAHDIYTQLTCNHR